MSWTHLMNNNSLAENTEPIDEPTLRARFRGLVFKELRIFYFILSLFTYFFIITLGVLYFGRLWEAHYDLAFVVSALSEPYMGALAIYTILKEHRKKTYKAGSFHKGEVFVGLWVVMLIAAILLTALSDNYTIGEPLRILISNSTAVILIYIGGLIHRP
ncbi:MAG: hypothetical protein HZA25_01850 [Candidatus Niyogibacteria bacterium]|nr:hypothetical protein [Candidatus Niyogibacteria bacterium]